MPFPFLILPRELRDMVYSYLMEEYEQKPHIPCLLASCHQIYNEMQVYIPHRRWGPNHICIGPLLTLALHSVDGPRGSRRARKYGGYSHWDLRPLSFLIIDLEYEGIIDNPYLSTLSPENYRDEPDAEFTAMNEIPDPRPTPQQMDAWLKQSVHRSHCWLERNLGNVYRALKAKSGLAEITFKIVVTRHDLVDFSPRGGFKRGIFQHLRAFTMLPLRCELNAVPVAYELSDTEHLREQQFKHSTAVAEWFNKRRARWLSRQEFLTRRTDFLWDVRVLFGDAPPPGAPPVLENPSIRCWRCKAIFSSNNKLHQHFPCFHNRYVEAGDYQGHYEYRYKCSREQVYRNWYDGYYRQPEPLHVRRNADGEEIPRPYTVPAALEKAKNVDGW